MDDGQTIFSVLICVARELPAFAIDAYNWTRFLSRASICAAEESWLCFPLLCPGISINLPTTEIIHLQSDEDYN